MANVDMLSRVDCWYRSRVWKTNRLDEQSCRSMHYYCMQCIKSQKFSIHSVDHFNNQLDLKRWSTPL